MKFSVDYNSQKVFIRDTFTFFLMLFLATQQ